MTLPRRRALVVVAAAVLGAVAALLWWPSTDRAAPAPPAPWTVQLTDWDRLLAGDDKVTADDYAALAGVHPGLTAADAAQAGQVAGAVLRADLTGTGRDAWPGYWPPAPTTRTPAAAECHSIDLLAASPARLDLPSGASGTYVKVLLAYAGRCDQRWTAAAPAVGYVYLRLVDGRWQPVRDWSIPQADADADDPAPAVEDWQLTDLGTCGRVDESRLRMRTLAAAAFTQMCTDADADGVVLVVASAYRTRAEQADLFDRAVEFYGSVDAARPWVAYADETVCESKHCVGLAVTVEDDHAAVGWLHQTVGCLPASGDTAGWRPGGECTPQEQPVKRMQRYGFAAPAPRMPGYLEFVLPTGDDTAAAADCTPAGMPVDRMVAAVFRCRLARAAVPAHRIDQVVSEALVVSRCASGWNPAARVFAGRYAEAPHPDNGRRYTEAGVFGLRGELVDAGWVVGEVSDPVANMHAAASVWLATRGWEQFPCATGTDPGLDVGPVLPAYGGPALPDWSLSY